MCRACNIDEVYRNRSYNIVVYTKKYSNVYEVATIVYTG